MHAKAWNAKHAGRIALFSILSFVYIVSIAAAEEQRPKAKTKSSAKAKVARATKPKSTPKIAAPEAALVSEDIALSSFDTFTLEWMKKLLETEDFRKTRAQVKPSPEGFIAEYTGYLPPRYIHIKKTESADTPYVGILTYYEKTLRCTGKTKEEALKGPFDQVGTSQVSEIFRFTKGKWVY